MPAHVNQVAYFGPFPNHFIRRCKSAGKFVTSSGLLYQADRGSFEVLVPRRVAFRSVLFRKEEDEDEAFLDFLLTLLAPFPEWRATAEEALAHPWLSQADG
mmetsp:Transcript_16610/g.37542  ORF Transcript_16610/g.37542 Transcript_16610/m.37542 type:complete len:101 (+) Transcript_16610:81-383(+)